MKNKYWIVDTDNLSIVKDIFIGYSISEDGSFYLNEKPKILDGTGCYTCIESFPDKIIICQDFLGMQGIYHFQHENRNIFSNGFKKIVDYIIGLKFPLTLDKNFCIHYIFSNEEPVNINDTMINEIKRIGKDYSIEISLDGKIKFIENDYEVNTIKIDSKEAIDIIDKWHNKWCNVFRNLVKLNSPILVDLSGGMDSRCCFGLLLNSNIDKNNIIIKRNVPKKTAYAKNYEDWDISQEIVDKYGYNNRVNIDKYNNIKNKDDKIIPTFEEFDNLIFGNSKICDYYLSIISEPVFHINGIYGDRMHLDGMDEIKEDIRNKKKKYKKEMKKEDIQILWDDLDKNLNIIIRKYKAKNRTLYHGDFFSEFIQRFYGSKITTKIFNNDLLITPFSDPLIHKIQIYLQGSKTYFYGYALIYFRYFEGLLNFRIQANPKPRYFTEEEINFAKKQCEKYPLKKIEYDYIPNLVDEKKVIGKLTFREDDIKKVLEKRLKESEEQFVNLFGKEYFEFALNDLKKESIKMQNFMTPIVAICSILKRLNNINK